MILEPKHARPTVFDLRDLAHTHVGPYVVHRHGGDHADDASCWCSPMVIDNDEVLSLSVWQLDRRLAEHFAIQ
jgi:hypothetical protein